MSEQQATTLLDEIIRGHRSIAQHEQAQAYEPHKKTERLVNLLAMHREAVAIADQAGVKKHEMPLVPVIHRWCAELGCGFAPDLPPPEAALVASATVPTAENAVDTSGNPEAPTDEAVENGILPKGKWVEAHRKIVEAEVPQVRAAAADGAAHLAAKREWLERNVPILREWAKKPAKNVSSPLFAYGILYAGDVGEVSLAVDLAELAIKLNQECPLNRNYKQLHWSVRADWLARQAVTVAAQGEQTAEYRRLESLCDELTASDFAGNPRKAELNKTFAELALAVGDTKAGMLAVNKCKFLDPNLGVKTLESKIRRANGEDVKDEPDNS